MKVKLIGILLFCGLCSLSARAQEEPRVQNLHTLKLALLSFTYSYEQALSRQMVVNGEVMLGTAFSSSRNRLTNRINTDYALTPRFRLEPRYYYNFLKRAQHGKETSFNSGNYWALAVSQTLNPVLHRAEFSTFKEFTIIPKWGIKRVIGKHLLFESAIGVGYGYNKIFGSGAQAGLDLRFGYAF